MTSEVVANVESTWEVAKFLLTASAPFIALGGAIWLFFIKRSTERADEARKRRQELYRSYLVSINDLGKFLASRKLNSEDALKAFAKVLSHHSDLEMSAPDSVVRRVYQLSDACKSVADFLWENALIDHDEVPLPPEFASQMGDKMHALNDARVAAVQAMREDILVGSKIKPGNVASWQADHVENGTVE